MGSGSPIWAQAPIESQTLVQAQAFIWAQAPPFKLKNAPINLGVIRTFRRLSTKQDSGFNRIQGSAGFRIQQGSRFSRIQDSVTRNSARFRIQRDSRLRIQQDSGFGKTQDSTGFRSRQDSGLSRILDSALRRIEDLSRIQDSARLSIINRIQQDSGFSPSQHSTGFRI